jgi:hypothetical protein
MLFGKRNRTSDDRVRELKARVDALRQADEAKREGPRTLDNFLEGDDVLTGREVEDSYQPTPWTDPDGDQELHGNGESPGWGQGDSSAGEAYQVDLEAELAKYLQREQERAQASGSNLTAVPSAEDTAQPGSAATGGEEASNPKASEWSWQPEAEGTGALEKWNREDWPVEEEWPPRSEAV